MLSTQSLRVKREISLLKYFLSLVLIGPSLAFFLHDVENIPLDAINVSLKLIQ